MKALFFEDKHKVAVKDVAVPECLPGTLLVKVEACGICGSDLHFFDGAWPRPAHVVGHEITARVIEVGDGVSGFAVGDRVTAECFASCGRCPSCLAGRYNLCTDREHGPYHGALTGSFAEFARLPAFISYRIPPSVGMEQAVMVEPLAVANHAAGMSAAAPGCYAVVIGGGTIGLLSAAVLKALMRLRCMIVVKYDHQAAFAQKLGIDRVHKVTAGKTADAVREFTGGRLADAVIDTIGTTAAMADALDAVRPAGTVCTLGLPGGRTIMPVGAIVGKEARVVGSNCYGYSGGTKDFELAIDLLASGAVEAEQIITHRFPFNEAQKAFETAAEKSSGSVKVILTL